MKIARFAGANGMQLVESVVTEKGEEKNVTNDDGGPKKRYSCNLCLGCSHCQGLCVCCVHSRRVKEPYTVSPTAVFFRC